MGEAMSARLPWPIVEVGEGKDWPCSVLLAMWALAYEGKTPASSELMSVDAWRALNPTLWDAVNITDHAKPWSGMPAIRQVLGGKLQSTGVISTANPAPTLPLGQWTAVQMWCGTPGPDGSGHAFLVYPTGPGFRVVDTNTSRGYRDTNKSAWTNKGCAYQLVTVPAESGRQLIIAVSAIGALLIAAVLWTLYADEDTSTRK